MNIKYLKHSSLLTSSSFSAVADFASIVHNNGLKVSAGQMTIQQFDDGIYIDVPSGLSDDETLQRNSINYIKRSMIIGGES
jgi:hypothetical protein